MILQFGTYTNKFTAAYWLGIYLVNVLFEDAEMFFVNFLSSNMNLL